MKITKKKHRYGQRLSLLAADVSFIGTKEEICDAGIFQFSERSERISQKQIYRPANFCLRCVRIQLSSGAEEILITNLERAEFPKRDLKKLYSLRWGIETSFNYLKNAVFVEEFTSRTENGLAQEYFVSLLIYNFSTCMFGSMQKDIPKKESTNTR